MIRSVGFSLFYFLLFPHDVFGGCGRGCLGFRLPVIGRSGWPRLGTIVLPLGHEMNGIRRNPHAALGLSVLLPAVLPQAAFHNNTTAFGQIFRTIFRGLTPHLHVKIGNFSHFFAIFSVHAIVGDGEAAYCFP